MKKVIILSVTLLMVLLTMTGCGSFAKRIILTEKTEETEDNTDEAISESEDEVTSEEEETVSIEEDETAPIEEAAPEENDDTSDENVDTTYLSYIDKIEIGDSLETINKALGCEGVLNPNTQATYEWTFERGGMCVTFKEDEDRAISIDLEYESRDIINDDAKIENLDELKEKVEKGITYDEFKEFLGGVDGVKDGKHTSTVDYSWKNSDGAWIGAGFRTEDNMCNSFVGAGR